MSAHPAYRPAHRLTADRRHARAELAVRDALVRTRTRYINRAKALVRRDGMRVASSASRTVARRIAALSETDVAVQRLRTAPAIGPVTAAAVVATIDDVSRFPSAHQFEAYLGMVPRERSSGEKRQLGHITKAGNGRVRWLLVEASWLILRSKRPESAALRAWALAIAARRGKRIAVVALARRLAGILYAMWRDATP